MFRETKPTGNYQEELYGWVVTYETGGKPVKYFRYDMEEVWKWTKTLNRASLFPCEEIAHIEMQSCEVGWRYQYEVRKISI